MLYPFLTIPVWALQEKAKETKKKIQPQERSLKELEATRDEKNKHQSKDYHATGNQVSEYNKLKLKAISNTHKAIILFHQLWCLVVADEKMQAKAALDKTERENTNDDLQAKSLNGELNGYRNRAESLAEKIKESQDEKTKIDRQFTSSFLVPSIVHWLCLEQRIHWAHRKRS